MNKTHAGLDIHGENFDVFMEVLRRSMTEQGITPSAGIDSLPC